MVHIWERIVVLLLTEEIMSWWFAGQSDISQFKTVATEEEGETQMVVETNIIKIKTLFSYNRTVMEAVLMVVHLSIRLCPENIIQLYL